MAKTNNQKTTYIGGQAVIEGVMMRGKVSMATAVRDEKGNIELEAVRITPPEKKSAILKWPIIRGVVSFFQSLIGGTKVLMRSATVYGEEDTSSEKDNAVLGFVTILSVFLGLAFSILLFYILPDFITGLFNLNSSSILYYLVEGLVRITIFVIYILLTSLLKDIRRTYMYHGAEHKTISCFESGLELNVENVKKCTRIHDRCGTTFLFIVMMISILVFALVNFVLKLNYEGFTGKLLRVGIKLCCLPFVAGLSYEILKLLAKTKGKFFKIFKAPGLALQYITTREPDDDMIEVAITAFNKVLKMESDENEPVCSFENYGNVGTLLNNVVTKFKKNNIDESDAEWLISLTLNIPRSQLKDNKELVKQEDYKKINSLVEKRLTGKPLWYILGNTEFYGLKINVNENVLIPRPETEELVENVLKLDLDNKDILDLCSGSGCISLAIKSKANVNIEGVDISYDAIEVANSNAKELNLDVKYYQSDLFSNVKKSFDVICSNPPYIRSGDIKNLSKEVSFEPVLALDGGKDGFDIYRRIALEAYKHLNDNGYIFMECGYDQGSELKKIFEETGNYTQIELIKDLNGIDRIIKIKKKGKYDK